MLVTHLMSLPRVRCNQRVRVGRVGTLATNYTPISIISVISLVGGYGGLWLLWRLVFSSKRTHDDTHDRDRIAAMRAAPGSQDPPPAPREDRGSSREAVD